MMETKLTKLQAYNAMVKFLDIYYELNKSDDLGSLLSVMQFLIDGGTADPAIWEDWLYSVNAVINMEEKKLTELQAFNAMRKFLDIYYEQTKSDDIGTLLSDTQFFSDGSTADPAAWHDWIKCVNASLNEPHGYKEIIKLNK